MLCEYVCECYVCYVSMRECYVMYVCECYVCYVSMCVM